MKRAIAMIYTVAAILALGIGFVAVPSDPLNFIFAVVLSLPWPLLAAYLAGDAQWSGPAVIIGSLALNVGLLWWWALRSQRRRDNQEARAR